jgi:glycosyltransferase involved in cell wall biosynthesis
MNTVLRVAMVTYYPADPNRISGGVQAVSARLVEAFRQVPDLDLHVVHCHSDIAQSRVEAQGNVTLHFIAQTRRRIAPNMITAIGLVARRLNEIAPDVIHAHDSPSFALAALRTGRPTIWTLHGLTAEEARHYRSLFHRLAHRLTLYHERRALARVPYLTAVSQHLVDAYRPLARTKKLPDATRWRVIGNPAPASCFSLPRRPVAGRLLMPAIVIRRKDPLTLVRAAAEVRRAIPELSVHVAGALLDGAYAVEVQAEIARLGLQETVTLLGGLDTPRLNEELSAASIVVLPSREESAPMALIEAMAAGAPVVATAVGGVPYLVEEGVVGRLVPPADPPALAAALTDLLRQPALCDRMGKAGQALARERFEPGRVAAQYLALYREAV